MVRYVVLTEFTEKGAQSIKQSTSRAHAFARAAAKSGVTIENHFWTLGRYDGVLILSGQKEEQVIHCLALLSAAGFVRTESLRAFNDEEFDAITGV